MKSNRIIAAVLCFVMILGVFSAFPAFISIKANAVMTNFAPLSTYMGASGTVTNGTGSYGEDNWNTYHTGKINDGTIDSTYTASGGNNVEIAMSGYVGGTIYVYFKLPYEITVKEVDIYSNIRQSSTNRTHPLTVNVYVANSETDVSTKTKLGTSTYYAYNTSVRNNVTQGSLTGSFVIMEFTTSNTLCFMALTEVQIFGVLPPSNNLAGSSTYRASDNCADNGDGTFGEADWNTYHSGRLNDGVIATTYTPSASSAVDRHTVEFWANTYADPQPGTVYLYFALPGKRTISQVNAFANIRENNTSRGYPTAMNIYVGNSETDISESTKLGTVSYSAYNTTVRKYTTSGSKTGSYVILEITSGDTAIVSALTEVEIIPQTIQSSGTQYRSDCVANGSADTDTYGEANWSTYHSGRLNDGTIASTYVPSASSTDKTNVEMYLTNFVSGNAYIYFQLPEEQEVSQVNVYANKRSGSANRGYPTAVNIYVGNSETDISESTKLGTSAYYSHNTAVRNYVTYGAKRGTYVILELGIDSTEVVIALTEVEILTNIIPNYTVTFVDKNGATISTQTVRDGDAATAPTAPSVEGYTFTGWDKAFDNITADTTVTALYSQNSYTVSFVGIDGTTIKTENVNYGESATAPEAPAVEGYDFVQWDTDYSAVKSDLTVTAVYQLKTFTVTFIANGETVKTENVNYGEAATAPEAPAVEGYDFVEWDTDYSAVKSDLTVTAVYQLKTFTVTFIANGETVKTENVNYGESATAPEAPAVEGYDFVEWDTDYSAVKSDLTVTAVYQLKTFTVTFIANGETVKTETVNYGEAATAPEAPSVEGYTFDKWDVEFDNVRADTVVTAVYTINNYTVSFVAGTNGALVGETTITAPYGTDLALLAYPDAVANAGYKFTDWDITSGVVTGDMTITASFEYDASQWFTVSFVIPETGTTADKTEFGPFVTGTAWADAGITMPTVTGVKLYVFSSWDAEAPETITENLTFTAVMKIEGNATITFNSGNNGLICYVVDGAVMIGEHSVTVAAGASYADTLAMPIPLADDGYVFDGWYIGDTVYDENALIDDSVTLTARFKSTAASITGSTVVINDMLATVTLTVEAESADFAGKMYVFNQFVGGRTAISINSVDAVLVDEASNTYEVSFTVEATQTEYVDVLFTEDAVDFTTGDWGIVTVITNIVIE